MVLPERGSTHAYGHQSSRIVSRTREKNRSPYFAPIIAATNATPSVHAAA